MLEAIEAGANLVNDLAQFIAFRGIRRGGIERGLRGRGDA